MKVHACVLLLALVPVAPLAAQTPCPSGPPCVDGPLPQLFPASNWWNLDVSAAPVDPGSAGYISFIGAWRSQPAPGLRWRGVARQREHLRDALRRRRGVSAEAGRLLRLLGRERRGIRPRRRDADPVLSDPRTGQDTEPLDRGRRAGEPGPRRRPPHADRRRRQQPPLRALRACTGPAAAGTGGSGAFFDLTASNRRPPGWTSADAAGLAILPGLVRYDEACGTEEITHAFRVTVHDTNSSTYGPPPTSPATTRAPRRWAPACA